MKIRIFLQLILAAILGIFGVSCEEEGEEYGCPTANFIMRGEIVNAKGEPLPDVVVKNVWMQYDPEWMIDSLRQYEDTIVDGDCSRYGYLEGFVAAKSDLSGKYDMWCDYYTEMQPSSEGYWFRFVGDTTLYEPYDTIIPNDSIVLTGGHGDWYGGKVELVLNVTLKEK